MLAACGGGSSYGPASSVAVGSVTIQASVSGLAAGGQVVLQDSLGDVLTIVSNGSSTFPNPVALGGSYSVTVRTQPTGQTCSLAASSAGAIVAGSVITASVTCAATSHAVSGSVSGLPSGATVSLALNGGAAVASANGAFSFSSLLAFGTAYSVAATPGVGINCSVANGTGTIAGAVSNVAVSCAASRPWVWQGGSSGTNSLGVYGAQGTPAVGNAPGGRQYAMSWTDASGKLLLFGGSGYASSGGSHLLNDLWSYDTRSSQWTWQTGSSSTATNGVYGTQRVAASGNAPGSRILGMTWIDTSGTLWLMGGNGSGATGSSQGALNDLWSYSVSTGQWTWQAGSSATNARGSYGTLGTAAAGNVPGAREYGAAGTGTDGKLWLFGGLGDTSSTSGFLNDLWNY